MIISLRIHILFHLLLFLASLLFTTAQTEKETQQSERSGTAVQLSDRPNRSNPITQRENHDILSSPFHVLSFLPTEEIDRQGVIGEYSDLQESPETSDSYTDEKGFTASTEDSASEKKRESTRNVPTLGRRATHHNTITTELYPTQTQQKLTTVQNNINDASMPSDIPQQKSSTLHFHGLDPTSKNPAPSRVTNGLERKPEVSVSTQGGRHGLTKSKDHGLYRESASMAVEEADLKTSGPFLLDVNMDDFATSCKTSNQSWTPTDPNNLAPEWWHRSLAPGPALLVPLYSDWNSALASWGFAWEAHVYGFSSVFAVFCLISMVSLLALPLRRPSRSFYFALLHLLILTFAGIQAFCLIYDAYSSQDRLPRLVSLMLYELTFPCLISSFSLVFLLLSFRSRMHLSVQLALSTPFSALPKPCALLCMSLLHFGISLGCVVILQIFPSLPDLILLFPHAVFVCFTTFLSIFYFIFYCLTWVNGKHVYQLDDSGESGRSLDVTQAARCPFAIKKDWDQAAAAAVGSSLCLLGCGGLQLYGLLHAAGLGGVNGYGFLPWPWWGYQVGCRLCESGACLGLCLVATRHLFCQHNSSSKTVTNRRPGSWSCLSCSLPSRRLTLSPQGHENPSIVTGHDSWSRDMQEKLLVCHVVTKGQSESLPLYSRADAQKNGLHKPTQTQALPLPAPSSPIEKANNALEAQSSCLYVLDCNSTVDLRPPSPIDLSRSIDQALFSESLFSQSIFGLSSYSCASSSLSLNSPSQARSKQAISAIGNSLSRTLSCGNVDQEKNTSVSKPPSHSNPPTSPERWDWKESASGSTQELCTRPKQTQKARSNSWANRGQSLTQNNLPRAIPRLSFYRHYRTLSVTSQDGQGCGRLAGTKALSESKQLEWDMAVQAEFVKVCKQIDALSICSDTIEL
ncbi:proline-rich transmembrane protein 4 [Gouania willdenowi]|uniref:proline-rich transmembrane protein 4 n=1 Tax=Gouania willdenowi TaxID=441366 RepID=UPI001054E970|nr:proline-rich transmembrane protein 4-like [Gouania willdenowi]